MQTLHNEGLEALHYDLNIREQWTVATELLVKLAEIGASLFL